MKQLLLAWLLVAAAASAIAQSMELEQSIIIPGNGVDLPIRADRPRFTFDLVGYTQGADWTGSEVAVDVFGPGRIWHATDQRLAYGPHPSDPNQSCYLHNLLSPDLPNTAQNRINTRMFDTFFTSPGPAFTIDPQFASPGQPPPPDACPPVPPIVSTDTRIRGLNPQGHETRLPWFDIVLAPLNHTVLARFTFEMSHEDLVLTLEPGPGATLFARIEGHISSIIRTEPAVLDVYYRWIPEPATAALLLLAASTLLRRSSRAR